MKKYLLIGAMAVALGFGATGARADDMPKAPTLTIDGGWDSWLVYQSIGANGKVGGPAAPVAESSAFYFENSNITFSASEKMDNGITVKASLNLNTGAMPWGPSGYTNSGANTLVGSENVTFSGSFGTIDLGRDNNVLTANAAGNCPDVAGIACDSPYLGVWAPNLNPATPLSNPALAAAAFLSGATHGGNGTGWTTFHDEGPIPEIAYTTPSFSGFQVAVDWQAPYNSAQGPFGANECGDGCSVPVNGSGVSGTAYHGVAIYNGTMGDVSISADAGVGKRSVGLALISAASGINGYTGTAATPNFDITAYEGGVQLGIKGFTIGGHVVDRQSSAGVNNAEKIQAQDGVSYDVGLGYASGPWALSVFYMDSVAPDGTYNTGVVAGTTNDEYQVYDLSGTYALGPGVTLKASVYSQVVTINAPAGVVGATPISEKSTTTGGILGTSISF